MIMGLIVRHSVKRRYLHGSSETWSECSVADLIQPLLLTRSSAWVGSLDNFHSYSGDGF